MTQTQAFHTHGLMAAVRAVLAALIAGAVIAMGLILAAFVTMAAFIVAAVGLAGAGAGGSTPKCAAAARPAATPRSWKPIAAPTAGRWTATSPKSALRTRSIFCRGAV